MARLFLFLAGLAILIIPEFLKVYYIMPFPGSQEEETISTAYALHNYIWFFRIVGLAMIAWPAYKYLTTRNIWVQWPVVVSIGLWLFVLYMANFVMMADEMFVQPRHVVMASVDQNKIPMKDLVVGVTMGGESRAYPIGVIGYHHQVRDSIGGQPIMVTYCTVCRTGRVFSPMVNGQIENFRLVGMDHYNAMFEDSRTGSWWRQANGEAITGALKGTTLPEIPSEQMTLSSWIEAHPDTKILQQDPDFLPRYDSSWLYDQGKSKGRLERRDSLSWKDKSWVIAVEQGNSARAYDWFETLNSHVVNDVIDATPLVLGIEKDSASFHVFQRPDTLQFSFDSAANAMRDDKTGSLWNRSGVAIDGPLKGSRLLKQKAYQEYWHSWKTFRPHTTEYHPQSK